MQSLSDLPKLPPTTTRKGCIDCLKICVHRDDQSQKHCIYRSLMAAVEGRVRVAEDGTVSTGLVFTGGRVGEIDDIVPVAKRIDNLVNEMKEDPRLAEAPAR